MIKERSEPPVTEEELKYLIDTGSQHGIIEKQEREIMHGVFRFGDRKVYTLMTHRTDIFWIDINKAKETIISEVHNTNFTKFPLCNGRLDDVLGVVSVKDVLTLAANDPEFDLKKIVKEAVFIPSVMPALKVLDLFKKKGIHIGFVLNEYGGVEGLVTLHDMIENIIGDLPEFESEEVLVVKREDGSWLVDAEIKIDELKRVIGVKKFPGENTYSTLAGFVVFQLHHIPKTGDIFEFEKIKFEVIDMDGNRIDKVLIQKMK